MTWRGFEWDKDCTLPERPANQLLTLRENTSIISAITEISEINRRILVPGATGLIGRHLLAALHAAGHEAIGARRHRPSRPAGHPVESPADHHTWHALDFAALTSAEAWLLVVYWLMVNKPL